MLVVELSRKLVIRDDLVRRRGFDKVPVTEVEKLACRLRCLFVQSLQDFIPRFLDQVSGEEVEETLHLFVESLQMFR